MHLRMMRPFLAALALLAGLALSPAAFAACGGTLTAQDNLAGVCDKAAARGFLGIQSMGTQAASSVAITGGTASGLTGLGMTSTGAFYGAAGTTGQQPTATAGGIRFNSSTGQLEFANGSGWTGLASGASISVLDDLTDVTISTPALGQCLKYNGSAWVNVGCSRSYGVAFGDGSAVTATGILPGVYIEDACTITKAVLMLYSFDTGTTSTTSVEVWASSSGIPTVSDKISASDPINTSAAAESVETTLSAWTTSVAAGTRVIFNITANDHATGGTAQVICK